MARLIALVAVIAVLGAAGIAGYLIQAGPSAATTSTSSAASSTITSFHSAPNLTTSPTQNGAQTETVTVTKTITDQSQATMTVTSCSQTSYVTVTMVTSTSAAAPQPTVTTTSTQTVHQPVYVSTVTRTGCAGTTSTITIGTTTVTTSVSQAAAFQSTFTATVVQASATTAQTHSNTYLSKCAPTGGAVMQLQLVSDKTGQQMKPNDTAANAVFSSGCNEEREVLYLTNVSAGPGGWFNFPHQSQNDDDIAGIFNFSLVFQGQLYQFQAPSHPVSTTCVTLSLPSGVVRVAQYGFASGDCRAP